MDNFIMWSPGVTLEQIEKQVIVRAYKHYRENKTATAASIGISIRTLDHKLEKYAQDAREQEVRDAEIRQRQDEWLARQRGQHPTIHAPGTSLSSPNAGRSVESAIGIAEEHGMPVPKRAQVQEMLSNETTQGRKGRRGGRVQKADEGT